MATNKIERLKPGDCFVCGQPGATDETAKMCVGCYKGALEAADEARQAVWDANFEESYVEDISDRYEELERDNYSFAGDE